MEAAAGSSSPTSSQVSVEPDADAGSAIPNDSDDCSFSSENSFAAAADLSPPMSYGIVKNWIQFSIQVGLIFFVGLLLGSVRTTVPLLAKREFAIESEALVSVFLIAFGAVKALLNLVGGYFSEFGRKRVAIVGWIASIPVVLLLLFGPSWGYVVAATMVLGFQQGLTWSMSVNAKIDLAKTEERGLAVGIDEAFGYGGVAVGAAIATFIADGTGELRPWPFIVAIVAVLGGVILIFLSNETLPWAHRKAPIAPAHERHGSSSSKSSSSDELPESTPEIKHHYRWVDLGLLCIAGHVEKWVDSVYWLMIPTLVRRADGNGILTVSELGVVVLVYGLSWGAFQIPAGLLADKTNRKFPVVLGMTVSGFATCAMAFFGQTFGSLTAFAAANGLGMALLYPNLITWFSDLMPPQTRAFGLGIYRTARDGGYAIGGLMLGLLLDSTTPDVSFVVVGATMIISGATLVFVRDKTHGPWLPKKNRGLFSMCRGH